MTREEAINELSVIHERLSHPEDCEQGVYSFRDGEYLEALDMAIKALELESCEDEYIKVPKKALKYRTAEIVAYNVEWLKKHFDMERAVIFAELAESEVEK